ncbi:MAG: hypothetical protein JWR84_1196 [Caulobacter sp.]|nr:hypothetical protein [Caulobacter sp.]
MERERLLKPYLRPDERLVWTGAPARGLVLTAQDIYLIPFSLMWGGFAIFWESTVLGTGAPGFMALFGIPFVLMGLFMIFGRFIADAILRNGMVYGLTDRRALILRRTFGESLTTVGLGDDIGLDRQGGGAGTVRFGPKQSIFGMGRGVAWSIWIPSLSPVPQFLRIPDADRVYALATGH